MIQICLCLLHTHPGALSPFYYYSFPPPKLYPSSSAAAERHIPGERLQVCHLGFLFLFLFLLLSEILPPRVKCPGWYTYPDKDSKVHRQRSLGAMSPISSLKTLRSSWLLVLSLLHASLLLLINQLSTSNFGSPRQHATFQSNQEKSPKCIESWPITGTG